MMHDEGKYRDRLDFDENIPRKKINYSRPDTIRILTFTSLYPSISQPRHGIFVETRLQHLIEDCQIDARVIAPVPWFPFRSAIFGRYAKFAHVSCEEIRAMGLKVTYPRYFMIPSIGVTFQPNNMARGALDAVRGFQRSGWLPDIIDGHYLYPDGVAAAIIAKRLGVPLVLTARGTDVNVFGRLKKSAEKILLATQQAAAVISVSDRLKEALIEIGVEESKITVLRNGVDLEVFKPIPQKIARDRLGLGDGKFALCVGNLVPEKGFSLALESLRLLPEFRLLLVGDGPDLEGLKALARSLGLERRVTFMAPMPQSELCDVYSCADVLLLTSTREGWPNVLLESLACGTPVVSVDVGAAAQVLRGTEAGKVIDSRDAQVFASAIRVMARSPGLRDVAHRHAAQFDWASISRGQFEIFRRALK